jgi:hypothetical protein
LTYLAWLAWLLGRRSERNRRRAGARLWLTGKRSAWVLLGAGHQASTLEELEIGAAVELPTPRARLGLAAWACKGGAANAEDDDLVNSRPPLPHPLIPRAATDITRTYVSFPQYTPGTNAAVSRLEDRLLAGIKVFRDPVAKQRRAADGPCRRCRHRCA